MNPVIRKLHEAQLRKDLPSSARVTPCALNVRLQEGEGEKVKERLQAIRGCGDLQEGPESSATFTVRRGQFRRGIERISRCTSPAIQFN